MMFILLGLMIVALVIGWVVTRLHGRPRRSLGFAIRVALIVVALVAGGVYFHGLSSRSVGSVHDISSPRTDPSTQPISLEVADDATDAQDKPAEGPDWVDAAPGKVDDGYQVVVSVGPYTTRMECDQSLSAPLQAAAAEYAQLYLGAEAEGRASLDDAFLQEHVVKEQWEETKTTSVGPMVVLHARAVFDTKANDQLKQSWRDAVVADRLWLTIWVMGVVLMAMTGLFVGLKHSNMAR